MFRIKKTKYYNYYERFDYKSPEFILFLMLFTFGLYAIHWVYKKNKEFEEISDEVPISLVGIFFILILPFFWFFFFSMYKLLFGEVLGVLIFERLGWIGIIFLILEYLYRFCDFFKLVA